MTNITVQCKGTMVHPNAIKQMIEKGFNLRPESVKQAISLFLLAGTLPDIPAGVLYDLAQGALPYKVDTAEETFVIIGADVPDAKLDENCEHVYAHPDLPQDYKFCPWCGGHR